MLTPKTWRDIISVKESHFPYVERCQECMGCGYSVQYKWWVSYNEVPHCETCEGRGHIIPQGWTEE